jgi:hypothetical protein
MQETSGQTGMACREMAVKLFDEAILKCDLDGLGAIPGTQLVEHRWNLLLDASLGNEQSTGDLTQRESRVRLARGSCLLPRMRPGRIHQHPGTAILFDDVPYDCLRAALPLFHVDLQEVGVRVVQPFPGGAAVVHLTHHAHACPA